MKCEKCDQPATFHISELTGVTPAEHHFCETHAREYLSSTAEPDKQNGGFLVNALSHVSKQISLNEAAEELQEQDLQTCPICGISFYEFRLRGLFGCPHDYDFFNPPMDAFIFNIHGSREHRGKSPAKQGGNEKNRMLLIKYRRDMEDAVQYEDYERAGQLRQKIKLLTEALNAD
ncbi:MAG: UvrB/UvrC motif-containing protein [Planctomycetaceae bacterium]|jgi:protein arginine kinase activator|nr:UvrB/UvrC motif-containing protein [Planctomycetaceae bacterium]